MSEGKATLQCVFWVRMVFRMGVCAFEGCIHLLGPAFLEVAWCGDEDPIESRGKDTGHSLDVLPCHSPEDENTAPSENLLHSFEHPLHRDRRMCSVYDAGYSTSASDELCSPW